MAQAANLSHNKAAKKILTDDVVAEYLEARPDFFQYYPHLMTDMLVPEKRTGDNVSDFQSVMINNLRHQLQESSIIIHELVETSRDNMYAQEQIHKAVLRFMNANNMMALTNIVTQDIAKAMSLDAVRILIEGEATSNITDRHIKIVPQGTIDQHMGQSVNEILWENELGDADIFGTYHHFIVSGVYMRMRLDSKYDGMIAFGAQEAGRFSPDLGAELLRFLCDSFAHNVMRIMNKDAA